jgi:uncharacterized membrane protein YadS
MAALMTWVPALKPVGSGIEAVAKRTMVLTLFLIGTSMTRDSFKKAGLRPMLHGVVLWALIATLTLSAIVIHWIN